MIRKSPLGGVTLWHLPYGFYWGWWCSQISQRWLYSERQDIHTLLGYLMSEITEESTTLPIRISVVFFSFQSIFKMNLFCKIEGEWQTFAWDFCYNIDHPRWYISALPPKKEKSVKEISEILKLKLRMCPKIALLSIFGKPWKWTKKEMITSLVTAAKLRTCFKIYGENVFILYW